MPAPCVWLCGRPGSGRSTIADLATRELRRRGVAVELLDGPEANEHLVLSLYRNDPASDPDLLRLAFVARLLTRHDTIAIVAADTSKHAIREQVRRSFSGIPWIEVHVDTPRPLCVQRRGQAIVDAASFEPPLVPDLRIVTHDRSPDASAAQLVSFLESRL